MGIILKTKYFKNWSYRKILMLKDVGPLKDSSDGENWIWKSQDTFLLFVWKWAKHYHWGHAFKHVQILKITNSDKNQDKKCRIFQHLFFVPVNLIGYSDNCKNRNKTRIISWVEKKKEFRFWHFVAWSNFQVLLPTITYLIHAQEDKTSVIISQVL